MSGRSACSTTCLNSNPTADAVCSAPLPVPQRPTARGSAQRRALLQHWRQSDRSAAPPYTRFSTATRRNRWCARRSRSPNDQSPSDSSISSRVKSRQLAAFHGQPDVSGEFANIKGEAATKSKKQRKKGKRPRRDQGRIIDTPWLCKSRCRLCARVRALRRTRPDSCFPQATGTSFSRTPITIFETCKPNSLWPGSSPPPLGSVLYQFERSSRKRRTWTDNPSVSRRRWQPVHLHPRVARPPALIGDLALLRSRGILLAPASCALPPRVRTKHRRALKI